MTQVRFAWQTPDSQLGLKPAAGSIRLLPTRRRWNDTSIVVPATMEFTLLGEGVLEVAPTGPEWCWAIQWTPTNAQGWTDHVLVPDADGVVEFKSLVHVDPRTFTPTATPSPAWVAELEKLRAEVQALPSGGGGLSVTDNGDGTLNIHSSPGVTDNGDGTLTIGA